MNLENWKAQTKERLQSFTSLVNSLAPGTIYGAMVACTVLPVITAASKGDLAALAALGAVLGDVGTGLVVNMIQKWSDRSERELATELAQKANSDPAWRAELDAIMMAIETPRIVQAILSEADYDRIMAGFRSELEQMGNLQRYEVVVGGSGNIIAQGTGAVAARQIGVSGNNYGNVIVIGDQDYTRERLWINVPTVPNIVVGREILMECLIQDLVSGGHSAISLFGQGGVGKSTLAAMLAHNKQVLAHFNDGVLWAGLGRNASVYSVQSSWLKAVGENPETIGDSQELHERLNQKLNEKRILVVLDDAWSLEAAQALQLSGDKICHLLTTRNTQTAEDFCDKQCVVEVPVLGDADAWLMLEMLASEVCRIDPAGARQVLNAMGGLPLGVELLGSFLGRPQHRMFPSVARNAVQQMMDPQKRLDLTRARLGDATKRKTSLESIIMLSLEELQEQEPNSARAFWALGSFAPKPATFDIEAAKVIAQADEVVVSSLANYNLVEITHQRVSIHPLVHSVAATHMGRKNLWLFDWHYEYYAKLFNDVEQNFDRIADQLDQVRYALEQGGFERFLASVQHEPWSLMRFAKVLQDLNRLDNALQVYDMVIGMPGCNAKALSYKAALLGRRREFKQAYDTAYAAYLCMQDDSSIVANLALQAMYLNRLDESKQRFMTALELNTENVLAWSGLSQTQMKLGKYGEAIESAQQAINRGHRDPRTFTTLGLAAKELRQYDRAIEALSKSIELSPNHPLPYSHLGEVYTALGDSRASEDEPEKAWQYYEMARQYYEKGTLLDPYNGQAWSGYGKVLNCLEEFSQAIHAHQQALANNFNGSAVYYGLARAYAGCDMEKDEKEAKRDFRLRKRDEAYLNSRTLVRRNEKLVWKAESARRKAEEGALDAEAACNDIFSLTECPPDALRLLCVAYCDISKFDKSLDCGVRALSLDVDNPHIWYALGRVLSKAYDFVYAAEMFEEALRIKPDYRKAKKGLYHARKALTYPIDRTSGTSC